MALRNQPYFPLYVQDYLTDEKLNLCAWRTQGIYIKILCILHKQKDYGKILYKQTDKQNSSKCLYFASILVKNLPCQLNEMIEALEELIEHEVLTIEEGNLVQRRMVIDNKISEARSKAGKKGGGNPILYKQTDKQQYKQKDKQNPEYEYEYESESINEFNKGGLGENLKNGKYDEAITDIMKFFVEITGRDYPLNNYEARKHISGKLKEGYTTEQLKNVIVLKKKESNEGLFKSVWLRPSTLFGDKFINYLNDVNDVRKGTYKNGNTSRDIEHKRLRDIPV